MDYLHTQTGQAMIAFANQEEEEEVEVSVQEEEDERSVLETDLTLSDLSGPLQPWLPDSPVKNHATL